MNEVLSGTNGLKLHENDINDINNKKKPNTNSNQDVLFTKSAKELFDMKYIPIK